MGQQLRKFKMSSATSNRSGASRQEYEPYAPIEAQPSGYVVETESEEPSSWQDDGGPSSSRSQQQITVGLNDTNLARVNEQPLVRGPLQQLDGASRQVKDRVKAINYEIDQLNTSISGRRESVQSLSERIANIHEILRQGRGGRREQQQQQQHQLEVQLYNTQQRIQQEEERVQDLFKQLWQEGQAVDGALRAQGLVTSRAGWQSRYPTRADMAEDTEGVPEEDRPQLNF